MSGPYPEYQKVRDAARNPRALEQGSFTAPDREGRPRGATESHERGLRAIDEYFSKGGLRSDAADRLDDLIRHRDRVGLEGRYLDAVGNPAYNSAFGKLLADPTAGHLRFSPQETEAMRVVTEAMSMRGMTIGGERDSRARSSSSNAGPRWFRSVAVGNQSSQIAQIPRLETTAGAKRPAVTVLQSKEVS